ncbi:MAG: NAD-dependent epimerase/dehydratase family protein [Deltaproteobacteria bacterium]|nr:NAD-dependent epimerase/dehydratase family protein [Deltaproteobacteria bacterium]MBI3388252.1 NAD-dependent epimerase/dehydratase family protein [Deltaproteobacteria bacterium]
MHILIIGGTRFVGYQLVWRLLAAGQRVTILNRGRTPDPFGNHERGNSIERLVADRTTPDFARVLAGRRFDAVVDFAAYTAADARGAVAALNGRVEHYVFISSGQVYLVRAGCPWPAREADYDGALIPDPTNDEEDHANWVYGVEKRAAEDVLANAWASARFPATRLRIPMVNGERDHFRRTESYLWRLLDGGPIILPDGGTRPMRHVYSGAVVQAIGALLGNAATFGEAYNLSQDETPTLAEMVSVLAELLGARARVVAVPSDAIRAAGLTPAAISPFSDPWMSQLDASKAKTALGFQHEPWRSYLDKIVACFINHPPTAPPENYAQREQERVLAARWS